MKVVFSFQKNNSVKSQKQNIEFGAGLTPKMMQEIQKADAFEISNRLTKKGIPADFKGNKVIAWCCDKTVKVFEQLNKKYHAKLALPKGIFVEDFKNLKIDNSNIPGFCNPTSTKLKNNSNEIIDPQTIFFNNYESILKDISNEVKHYYDWNYIDEIADYDFSNKGSSTNHFLYYFLHEFSHASHENRLLKKIGGQAFDEKIDSVRSKEQIEDYHKKYGQKISIICNNALDDPFEAIACDMPRIIASSLDQETLIPAGNPFIGTPYENLSFWQRVNLTPHDKNEEISLHEILRNFWNGKFN